MKIFEYMKEKYLLPKPTVLTASEAHAFGIPFPLHNGWMQEHCDREITPEMRNAAILRLQRKIENESKGAGVPSPYHQRGIDILKTIK